MTHIRHATQHDLDYLVALENTCFTTDKMQRRNFRELLSKTSAEILVAESENKIVGCAILLFRKNSFNARMYSLAVDPAYRNVGIAHQLCAQLEKRALARHCTSIILEVRIDNSTAIHFYQKNGYEIFATYTKFYEDGADALRMKKNL